MKSKSKKSGWICLEKRVSSLYCRLYNWQGLASGQPPGENGTPGGVATSGGVGINQSAIMAQQNRTLRDPLIGGMGANPSSYPQYSQQRDPRALFTAAQMYQNYPQKVNPAPTSAPLSGSYPIHPDVRFKNLPFYDLLAELLKPSSLMPQNNQRIQEGAFVFHLTPSQASDIALSKDVGPGSKTDYVIQVQMRFCLLETSCEQEDFFPPGVIVKLNGKICPLPNPIPTNKPNVDPKRPPRPVNVTNFVRLSPTVTNHVNITWAAEYGRGYAVGIYLVRKLTSSQLLQRLKAKGVRHADYTTGLIKEKLNEDADSEIATTSLRVSLICPLGKMRMSTPCRASTCLHLQCFDASLFLQMNERKPTWICPVCDKPCLFDKLVIDGYFQEVLQSVHLPSDITEVQLHQDGSWSTLNIKKDPPRSLSDTSSKKQLIPTILETIPLDETDGGPNDTDDVIAEGGASNSSSCSSAIAVTSTITNSTSSTGGGNSSAVIAAPGEGGLNKEGAPKRKLVVIDLTISDSDDDDDDDQPVQVAKRTNNNDSNSNLSATGRSSVTSSGYTSPNIITLDSPSPPPDNSAPSPTPLIPVSVGANNNSSSCSSNSSSGGAISNLGNSSGVPSSVTPTLVQQQQYHTTPLQPSLPTIFDLEQDSNGSSSLFQTRY